MGRRRIQRYTEWERHSWLAHGFSTRLSGSFLDWPSDREIAKIFGVSGCGTAMLRQVHSNGCVRADRPWGPERPEADAVVTDRPGIMVGVRTADCYPILLADARRRAVAAVHAGWRGTVAGVVPAALEEMAASFGTRPRDVEAVIGAGIGPCCFEVGPKVANQFPGELVERRRPKPHVNRRRAFVDLPAAVESQLVEAGVERIASVGECTNCEIYTYFSHRGELGKTGRMLAVVCLLEA